jgi:hypothetical protein
LITANTLGTGVIDQMLAMADRGEAELKLIEVMEPHLGESESAHQQHPD